MRRWPLSTAALLLVLAAHLAVALAGEPSCPATPIVRRGWVEVGDPGAGVMGYDLITEAGKYRRYMLLPTSEVHRDVLRRNSEKRRDVEVAGILSFVGDQPLIMIENVKELP